MFSSAMYTIDAAIAVSTNGGNQAPEGARSYADPISVNECATVKAVMIGITCPTAAKGMIRQSRKRRWSVPERMGTTTSQTKPAAARYQGGFSDPFPERLLITIARPSSPGGRYRTASLTNPTMSGNTRVWIENRDCGEEIGYVRCASRKP